MPTTFPFTGPCSIRTLSVRAVVYAHGNGLAVQLIDEEDGEPYATVSLNLGGVALADDEFVFKTYSENDGLLDAMLAGGIVEKTGRVVEVGFAGAQPICRLLKW